MKKEREKVNKEKNGNLSSGRSRWLQERRPRPISGSKQVWRVDWTVIDKWISHQYLKTDAGIQCDFVLHVFKCNCSWRQYDF